MRTCVLALLPLLAAPAFAADLPSLQQVFQNPPVDARPMVRYWWFGPAVTQREIGRELAAMKSGGFQGFELQTTYPLATGSNPPGVSNFKFKSPEHLADIHYAAQQAKALGLRMDLTLGSGWPYGGATTPIDLAAGRIRIVKADAPSASLRDGETLLATVNGMSFISSRTRMQVKRPAWGAEGNVLDHLDDAAVQHFLQTVADPAVNACGDDVPHSVFCDSLECYGEDWTPKFLDEFQRRRGYDLTPLLPELVAKDAASAEVRHDWGQTLTEVFNDNFVKPITAYAHAHHTLFRIQAYGTPSAGESSYQYCDLPEGEGFQWRKFRETRYASSACHLLGVPVSSSETFTWLHPPVFRATPLDIKGEANLHFLQGVNQIICHGWPYSPPQAGEPGWSFYASGVFNDHNPWWGVMPDVTSYLSRCSQMLRQGEPANDVLLYLPNNDAWAHFTPGHVSLTETLGERLGPNIVSSILDGGYDLDFFDDQLLADRGKVDGGTIAFGKLHYKVVVLAGVERIPPATLAMLEKFVQGGGILIATRQLPSLAPGHLATAADQQAVHDAVQRLFHGDHPQAIFVQDESKLGEALSQRLQPDVRFDKPHPEIGFVHRRDGEHDIYFLANTSNQPVEVTPTFRDQRQAGEQWDPMTGKVSDSGAGPIFLDAYQSMFFVFSGEPVASSAGAEAKHVVKRLAVSLSQQAIQDNWSVQFGDAAPTTMATLHSWTEDAATRNFSGTATYTRHLSNPRSLIQPGQRLILDFGAGKPQPPQDTGRAGSGFMAEYEPPVAEAAIVYVNGKCVGSAWCPPYRIDITDALKDGENELRIEVSNTAVNELAGGKFPNYDYRGLTKEFGNRFQPARPSQFEPVKSGLLGEVSLIAEAPR